MIIKVKPFGIISQLNGISISQTCVYIKISNATYFTTILEDKNTSSHPPHTYPIPMNSDSVFNGRM